MKVKHLQLNHIKIPLRSRVAHHLRSYNCSESVLVKVITDAGALGWGEARPRTYLTGETISSVEKDIARFAVAHLAGKRFSSVAAVVKHLHHVIPVPRHQLAAFTGLELAVLDAAGRTFRRHLQSVIGYCTGGTPVEAANIGFQTPFEEIPKACLAAQLSGYRAVKVKAGLDDDIDRIAAIRRFLGKNIFIWIDANGAWDYSMALHMINKYRTFGVDVVEQPVPALQIENLARLREKTGARIVADESLCSLADARDLVKERACDFFNIRVGKCGGLIRSLELIRLAARHGIGCFLGSLVAETGILLQPLKMLARGVEGARIVEGLRQNRSLLTDDVVIGHTYCGTGALVSEHKTAQYSSNISRVDL